MEDSGREADATLGISCPVQPITVADASFTLNANARDCPPLQLAREFTINGLEAIGARRAADHRAAAATHSHNSRNSRRSVLGSRAFGVIRHQFRARPSSNRV
jgi:hypothetical protein